MQTEQQLYHSLQHIMFIILMNTRCPIQFYNSVPVYYIRITCLCNVYPHIPIHEIHLRSQIGRFTFSNRENDEIKKEILDFLQGDQKYEIGRCISYTGKF